MKKRNNFTQVQALKIFIAIIVSVFGMSFWLDAFLKLSEMRLPYKLFFSLFLFGFTLITSMSLTKSLTLNILLGGVAGQISGFGALFIANLFIHNGISRAMRSVNSMGIIEILEIDFSVAFLLGGWLLGASLYAILFFSIAKKME